MTNYLKRFSFIIPLALTVFSFIKIHPYLLNEPLHIDEVISWEWMLNSWSYLAERLLADTQTPLYYVLQKLYLLIIPGNDYWLRILPFFFFVVSLFALFSFSQKKIGIWGAALVTSMYLSNDLIEKHSIFARPYSLLVLLVMINLLSFMKGRTQQISLSKNYWFIISLILIPYTHHLGFIYEFSLLLTSVFLYTRREILKTLLIVLPFIAPIIILLFFQYGQAMNYISWVNNPVYTKSSYLFFFDSRSYPVLMVILFLTAWKKFSKNFGLSREQKFLVINLILNLGFILIYSEMQTSLLIDRYFCFLLPSVFLLIVYFWEERPFKPSFLIIGTLILLITSTFPDFIFKSRLHLKEVVQDLPQKLIDDRNGCLIGTNLPLFRPYAMEKYKKDICDIYLLSPEGSEVLENLIILKKNFYKELMTSRQVEREFEDFIVLGKKERP